MPIKWGMDWKKLITELSEKGLTQQAIAKFCGCAQSTISDLFTGEIKEPKYSIAVSLVNLSENPDLSKEQEGA